MKGIHSAFVGRVIRSAEARTAKSGRPWLSLTVMVGEDEDAQRISVAAFRDSVMDLAPQLVEGTEVYVEGTLKMRTWDSVPGLQVSASTLQPMGLIGAKKPKAPPRAKKAKVDHQAPLGFTDGTDARVGDEMPF